MLNHRKILRSKTCFRKYFKFYFKDLKVIKSRGRRGAPKPTALELRAGGKPSNGWHLPPRLQSVVLYCFICSRCWYSESQRTLMDNHQRSTSWQWWGAHVEQLGSHARSHSCFLANNWMRASQNCLTCYSMESIEQPTRICHWYLSLLRLIGFSMTLQWLGDSTEHRYGTDIDYFPRKCLISDQRNRCRFL